MSAPIPPVTPSAPSAQSLEWAADMVGADRIARTEALPGGTAAHVWRLEWTASGTAEGAAILKQARNRNGAGIGGDASLIGQEFRVLDALRPLDLPVPVPLACDPAGGRCGQPTLLMSVLPGALLQGAAALRAAIGPMAEALAEFQQRCNGLVAGRRYRPWHDPGSAAPSWSSREALWVRAQRVAARFPAPVPNSFVHRDPHPANLLFIDGNGDAKGGPPRLSGILDWPHAGRGPSGIDASRMALNLACLLDMEAALEFRRRFETARGLRQDPLLDVLATLEFGPDAGGTATWDALGVALTRDQVREHIERFLEDAMRRMTTRRVT